MMDAVRGLVALQSLSTIKKGIRPFNLQSIEPFSKLLRQQMGISNFLSDAFRENQGVRLCGGGEYTPSHHSESQKGTKT